MADGQLFAGEDGCYHDDGLNAVVIAEKGQQKAQQVGIGRDFLKGAQIAAPAADGQGSTRGPLFVLQVTKGGQGKERPPEPGKQKTDPAGDGTVSQSEECRSADENEDQQQGQAAAQIAEGEAPGRQAVHLRPLG